jgi:hypothetical protein
MRGLAALALGAVAAAGAGAAPDPAPAGGQAALVAALRAKVALDPVDVAGDPYETWRRRAPPRAPEGTVCGVRFEPDGIRYRLATFASAAVAREAGWSVTHLGACGTCSTMQDLAVYLERPDLTAPVRRCGVLHPTEAGGIACLERLGFSPACARTWFFDVGNTRRECLGVCVLSWLEREPATAGPERRLNACLRCDEERSGPVFKAVAGRTRRDSGIPSSIARPDADVAHVVHDYVPGVGSR